VRLFVIREFPRGGFDIFLLDKAMIPYIRDSSKNINANLLSFWLGIPHSVITYERQERRHGKSRWTFAKKLTLFTDSILGFSALPMRVTCAIGVLVSLISVAYGSLIVVDALLGNRPVPGFATLAAMISLLLGLIIIMMGMIGEYIWRIFNEVSKLPEVVVDQIYE
jgi:dolichol-phosphate mannosyltransferase